MSTARDLLAVLLLIAATLLASFWLPAAWLQSHVVDQDGFVEITQPLADDPAFQRTLTDGAVETILRDETVPGWIADSLTPIAQEQAARATGTEVYTTVWDAAMIELHGALFSPGSSDLEVDLAPVIDTLLTGVEEQVPLLDVPRPDSAAVTIATIPDIPLLTHATALDPWAQRAGPIALGLAVLALLIARHRRGMLMLAGLGTMLAGLGTWALAQRVEDLVPDRVDQKAFLGPIVQAFEQRFTADVTPQGVILLGVGALVAAAGLVLIGLRRRS
ncbi:hypothetical protein BH708_18370 [Brachybacterium sp. P6-10-X1]|uniref:hypothetical protein n=1 Tax=Brachybacterium sp. P6-10-X1 TaxID=1903186 RepID=UPI0009717710|nr:hypothetical protein [Brachybacterium sp. P6-10-X1]APX34349.1 hypothetical protein BH708_18370 [Brachybacterium sp. P6-10-X1]